MYLPWFVFTPHSPYFPHSSTHLHDTSYKDASLESRGHPPVSRSYSANPSLPRKCLLTSTTPTYTDVFFIWSWMAIYNGLDVISDDFSFRYLSPRHTCLQRWAQVYNLPRSKSLLPPQLKCLSREWYYVDDHTLFSFLHFLVLATR